MSAAAAALRIARRNARRSRGRSALIMVMIGLPVLVITALLTYLQTANVTSAEGLAAQLGAADARLVQTVEGTVLHQGPDGTTWNTGDASGRFRPGAAEAAALLGPDARLVPYSTGTVKLAGERVQAVETDLRDPLTKGLLTLSEGRLPAAGEVAVTPALGLRPGDVLRPSGAAPLTVTGVVDHPHEPSLSIVVGPDLPITTEDPFWSLRGDGGAGWLVDTPKPVSWTDVSAMNAAGLYVTFRSMLTEARHVRVSSFDAQSTVGLGVMVIMLVLETALLAGPAFAVGLRRRRRELAQIAAQGGSARQLRTIVLADGLLLGGVATVLATALG
ncbi:MAG TPA: hypothetical protein VGF17_18300, partial [Phytomonospora sp.]